MARTILADVAIIGGGIVGCSAALFLQRRGRRAVVLERGIIAGEASGRNAGGLRQQGRVLSELPFAAGALALWRRLDGLLGRPTGFRPTGGLYLARTDAELALLVEQRRREAPLGLATELLDAGQVRLLSPGLSPRFSGGKLCPSDGHAIPAQATVAIAEAATAAGAEFVCHTAVERIGVRDDRVAYVEGGEVRVEAPMVLDAAGAWAPYVAQLVGAYLPIFPSRSYQLLTPPCDPLAGPFTLLVDGSFNAIQHADGRMQITGGANRGDPSRFSYRNRLPDEQARGIRTRAAEVFPALADVPIEAGWAGIREYTPDMSPILGPLDTPGGFFVCAGFSGHGFTLGPYAGQLMAEWIADGTPSLDLSAFRLERFRHPGGPLAGATPAGVE